MVSTANLINYWKSCQFLVDWGFSYLCLLYEARRVWATPRASAGYLWLSSTFTWKVIRILESRKHLLVESGIQRNICLWNLESKETFACGIWNPGLGIWNPRKVTSWSLESNEVESWIQYLGSGVHIFYSGIQDYHSLPYTGNLFKWNTSLSQCLPCLLSILLPIISWKAQM